MSDKCPCEYAGKTIPVPHGYYPYGFDKMDNLMLSANTHIVFMDTALKIIAKVNVRGDIAEYKDGYILTASYDSFYAYEYNPDAKIRIYKIIY